ncbi:MAG: hypothetical protein ACPGUD_10225 [Parashewanella sp.]
MATAFVSMKQFDIGEFTINSEQQVNANFNHQSIAQLRLQTVRAKGKVYTCQLTFLFSDENGSERITAEFSFKEHLPSLLNFYKKFEKQFTARLDPVDGLYISNESHRQQVSEKIETGLNDHESKVNLSVSDSPHLAPLGIDEAEGEDYCVYDFEETKKNMAFESITSANSTSAITSSPPDVRMSYRRSKIVSFVDVEEELKGEAIQQIVAITSKGCFSCIIPELLGYLEQNPQALIIFDIREMQLIDTSKIEVNEESWLDLASFKGAISENCPKIKFGIYDTSRLSYAKKTDSNTFMTQLIDHVIFQPETLNDFSRLKKRLNPLSTHGLTFITLNRLTYDHLTQTALQSQDDTNNYILLTINDT